MTKKGLALTLAAVMVWAVAVPAFGQVLPFRDVSRDHWAYEAVRALAEAGLVEGYPDGTFGGERTFTRYEMAMVFARILARLEQLLEDRVQDTVDERIADLWAAVQELRAQLGMASAPGETGIQPPIMLERQQRADGTTDTVVRLSPEMEDAVRAIAADQFREELGSTASEVIAQLLDEATLRALIDARANELAGHITALANEFRSELELLGVRVTELERLFDTLEARVTALEQQVAEARSAAETAQGVADAAAASARAAEEAAQRARQRADEAWRMVARLRAEGADEDDILDATDFALDADEAADTAEERAYRARLAAQRAQALAQQAQEAAERAGAIAEVAHADAREAMTVAQEAHAVATKALEEAAQQAEMARSEALEALERAQRADQQAYRAQQTAERALARVDELQEQVSELARRPVLGGDVRVDYENTVTSDGNKKPIDPRDTDGDKIKPKKKFETSVGLKAAVKPSDTVTVEGGLRLRAPLWGESTGVVRLSDVHLKVTTESTLRMLYFGGITGEQLAEGFNKFTLDPKTYEAKVAEENRAAGIVDAQIGNVSTRLIAARAEEPGTDPEVQTVLYGIAVGVPLSDGLNVRANYLWWSEADRVTSVQAYGETAGINYDAIYALYQDNPAIDAKLNTTLGDLRLGFSYGLVDAAFAPQGTPKDKDDDDEKRQLLKQFGKLLDEDDGDLEPDQRKYVAEAELPLSFLTALAEKGRHDKKVSEPDSDYTDWFMFGFKDLDILGFNIGARAYNDTRDNDRSTQILRADVSRTFQLGVPLTFTGAYATAKLSGTWTDPSWDEATHLALGVAVNDYALSDALTLNASYKTEQNPIEDDDWTEPEKWMEPFEDDEEKQHPIYNRDTASIGLKFQATQALSFHGGYTLERWDLNDDGDREVTVGTATLGADLTFNMAGADVTLGYGYEYRSMDGFPGLYRPSPKHTYSVGIKREILGATFDASYKVVTGRGTDDREKVNATDTIAQVNVTYPLAEALNFTLSAKWGQSSDNTPDSNDYHYSSIKGGLSYEF